MRAGEATSTLTAGVALLERALGYTLGSLLLAGPYARSTPTPCPAWDLGDLLRHMDDSLLTLDEAMTDGYVGLDPVRSLGRAAVEAPGEGPVAVADLVALVRNRGCRMLGTWVSMRGSPQPSIAGRCLPSSVVAVTGALEVAVHGWDVARACGQDRPIPPGLAEDLLELGRLVVSDRDRPHRFAAAVEPLPEASAGDRLVAFLGRAPA